MNLNTLEQLPVGKRNKRLEKKLCLGEYTRYWFNAEYSFQEELTQDGLDLLIDCLYDIAESCDNNCWLMITGNCKGIRIGFYNQLKLEGGVCMFNVSKSTVESIGGELKNSFVELLGE